MNLFWVGGSGNWSDATNHWATESGGTPHADNLPTSSDDVFFDANSFTGTNDIVLLDAGDCRNMDWTGATGTPHFKGDDIGTLYLYGSLTFIENMYVYDYDRDYSGSGPDPNINIYVVGTNIDKTIQPAGQHWCIFLWENIVGTEKITLLGDLDVNYLEPYWGTFDANDYNVSTTGYVYIRAYDAGADPEVSPAWEPTVYMGSGTWTPGRYGWYVYDDTEAEVTIYAETSTIKWTTSDDNFYGAGKTYNNLWIYEGMCNYIRGSNTFNEVRLEPGTSLYLQNGQTQTVSSFVATGESGNLITVSASSWGDLDQQATLVKTRGITECDYLDLRYTNATGGIWYAGANSTDSGNNTGWIFTDRKDPLPGFRPS